MELEVSHASSTFKNAVFNVIHVKKRKQPEVTQTVEELRMQQCCGRHALGFFSTDEGTLDYYEPVEIKKKVRYWRG